MVSRILFDRQASDALPSATIIPLGFALLQTSSDLTRRPRAGRPLSLKTEVPNALPSYLILLRAEFGCFHSGSSWMISRSRSSAQGPGPSLCSTVPTVSREGR